MSGTLLGCAEVSVPEARNVNIPTPVSPDNRREAVNERPDSVMYLPLGEDVLLPARMVGQELPAEVVGPFELRSETLAGALQLILADYDVSIAFETDVGLTRQVTVANLKGPLDEVVKRVCSLADLYCSYEGGTVIVKDTQTFTVSLPPLGDVDGGQEFIDDVIAGLTAVIGDNGSTPVSDPTTRTIIYSASQRTSQLAENYFQRLRANTAMIVFETYIWEVSLNAGNSTGIDWDQVESFGKFNTSIGLSGSVGADFTNPVSIGLPTTQTIGATPTQLLEFLSQFGAVKTISQPQITVLSGASAELRVADTENFVSEVTSTVSGDNTTTSVSTDSVDSGFTLTIGSSWDKSTVYANVDINLTNVDQIEDFAFDTDSGGGQTTIQLPQTSERELSTQIRVRPGDSVLIAGLVRESDNFSSRGPGFMRPVFADSRTSQTDNLELVVLLRPRVIVYTASDDPNYLRFVGNKAESLLQSSALRRKQVTTPVTTTVTVPPVARKAPLSVVEPEALAPVVAIDTAPTYENTVDVTRNVVSQHQPVNRPARIYDNVSSEYSQDYLPSQASGYVPGYVSGQSSLSYQARQNIPSTSVDGYQAQIPSPLPVAPPPVPVLPASGNVYSTNSAPLSADIYNGAKPLNVYEIYEQGQNNQ